MRPRILFYYLILLLLLSFSPIVLACDPPSCDDCYEWNGEDCVLEDDCADDGDCGDCESCEDCSCDEECYNWEECCDDECEECCDDSDCPGECHICDDYNHCVDDNSKCSGCQVCHSGTCEDSDYECNWRLCQECNDGVCEDKCPALGKVCDYDTGFCVECYNVADCPLCYDCKYHECVHFCDDCDSPKYCSSACVCVECYYGEEDTTTCSYMQNITECGCSINLLNPCSSSATSVVYSGASLKSCTGPDCGSVNVLCYTTYQTCITSGSYQALLWCLYATPGPRSCGMIMDQVGPGCYTCVVNTSGAGNPTNAPQGDCPIESWP